MTDHRSSNRLPALCIVVFALVAAGCGSQQLRLSSPNTAAGIAYTCTSANTCYPGSAAIPEEGAKDKAIPLTLPQECAGMIHEILIRNADSSSPEIDVTCARPKAPAAADVGAQPAPPGS